MGRAEKGGHINLRVSREQKEMVQDLARELETSTTDAILTAVAATRACGYVGEVPGADAYIVDDWELRETSREVPRAVLALKTSAEEVGRAAEALREAREDGRAIEGEARSLAKGMDDYAVAARRAIRALNDLAARLDRVSSVSSAVNERLSIHLARRHVPAAGEGMPRDDGEAHVDADRDEDGDDCDHASPEEAGNRQATLFDWS